MEVNDVANELRRLNGKAPVWNPEAPVGEETNKWMKWSAGEALIAKFEEQCSKRTEASREKIRAARSISTAEPRSRDYINHPGTG